MDKIKFYSFNGFPIELELRKLEIKIKVFDENRTEYNINEIIEFFNINRYIEEKLYIKEWDNDYIQNLDYYKNIFKRIIGRFLNTISNHTIITIYEKCDIEYKEEFWQLIESFKLYKRIDSKILDTLLKTENINIYQILRHKELVNYYGESIKKYLIASDLSAIILLDKYVMENRSRNSLYIPKELTFEDKELILYKYINGSNPSINYLEAISKARGTDNFRISDKVKVYAKKRAKKEIDKLFDVSTGIKSEFSVVCSKEQNEEVKFINCNNSIEFSYSYRWIEENNDYNTLLNNFIFLFEFVDRNNRFSLLSKQNELTIIEKVSSRNAKDSYKTGYIFDFKHSLSILQIQSYYDVLIMVGIRLEVIIKWFFEVYLFNEFNIENFILNIPSENTLFFEKCRFILPEMEFILKQYSLFVSDGYIDHEILQISSNHLIFKDIPSLLSNKYAYPLGDEFQKVTYYLFSNQCMLSYVKRYEEKYKTFYELLVNENIYISDYNNICITKINWLKDNNYITLNDLGKIEFLDINKIIILKDLYMNEFINYYRCTEIHRDILDSMNRDGMIEFESKLFSRQESNYINYYLNKSTFDNSLDLRNMYSHGTQPNPDDDFHRGNYFVFLRLFILIIIKINDELDINEKIL